MNSIDELYGMIGETNKNLEDLNKRLDSIDRNTQEFMNRIVFQQEKLDQVVCSHGKFLESMSNTIDRFLGQELTLRGWFMEQVDKNREFTSGLVFKLVGVFCLLVMGILGIDYVFG